MRGTPAQGNVHAKTGYIDKARSLSGYVTTADGRMLLFSALCNNYSVPTTARRARAGRARRATRLAAPADDVSVTRLSVAEASAHMLAGVAPLADETMRSARRARRVLARDVASPVSLPPWDNASMDGFAVRADDVRGAIAATARATPRRRDDRGGRRRDARARARERRCAS